MEKEDVTARLVACLFDADSKVLARRIDSMDTKNMELKRLTSDGFIYKGTFYTTKAGKTLVGGPHLSRATLHQSLWGEMEEWVLDKKAFDADQELTRLNLYRLFRPCKTHQDMRDALPECLVPFIRAFEGLNRTREMAFTIRDNDHAIGEFWKFLPKMEAYSVARLLY